MPQQTQWITLRFQSSKALSILLIKQELPLPKQWYPMTKHLSYLRTSDQWTWACPKTAHCPTHQLKPCLSTSLIPKNASSGMAVSPLSFTTRSIVVLGGSPWQRLPSMTSLQVSRNCSNSSRSTTTTYPLRSRVIYLTTTGNNYCQQQCQQLSQCQPNANQPTQKQSMN